MKAAEGDKRCGFVAVIGAPNAGKSTLMNVLVGSKVSIVSPKVQTTRTIVRGIAVRGESQVIFIDTPGIFSPKKRLERAMVAAAWDGNKDADMVVLVVDVSRRKLDRDTDGIITKLAAQKTQEKTRPCLLVLNKIDEIRPDGLLAFSQALNDRLSFDATFMISALKGNGTEDIIKYLAEHMPAGPWLYPEDQISDMPVRLLAEEITREKLFSALHQELPYDLMVETEKWEDFKDGSIKIDQIVYIARESHKPIILGKGGGKIKAVGTAARQELEEILETRVHLKLFVKVQEGWADNPDFYRVQGLDYRA